MKNRAITQSERIGHAIDSIGHIMKICEGVDRDEFEQNLMVYSACLYQYAVVAEALSHVDSDILSKYDYPWYRVKSFRNFILHEYHFITLRTVYDTTATMLPDLKKLLIEILEKEFSEKS